MTERPRQLDAAQYCTRAVRRLLNCAPWLLKHRRARGVVLSRDTPVLGSSEIRTRRRTLGEWLRSHGFTGSLLGGGQDSVEFVVDAPRQPRALHVERALGRERLAPLRMCVVIDGRRWQCRLEYAGFSWHSPQHWTRNEPEAFARTRAYPCDPEADADALLELVHGIVDERLALLRSVRWGDPGHGSPLYAIASDVVVALRDPIEMPAGRPSLETSVEAIVYSWSGELDMQLVPPRYDETRG